MSALRLPHMQAWNCKPPPSRIFLLHASGVQYNAGMNVAPHPRLWFRFSLRTLLLIVTLVSAGFGLLGVKLREADRQRQAVAAIRGMMGEIRYDYERRFIPPRRPVPPGPAWLRNLLGNDLFVTVDDITIYPNADELITDDFLHHVRALPEIRNLRLGGQTKITDAGLVYLEGLTQLEYLDLCRTQVTDRGLDRLPSATQLLFLLVDYTQITDAGLQQVGRWPQLTNLSLDHTQITDAGLMHVQGLTQLKYLSLDSTQVTDAGLIHLKNLNQLKGITLFHTQVTQAGCRELHRALPNLEILHSFSGVRWAPPRLAAARSGSACDGSPLELAFPP